MKLIIWICPLCDRCEETSEAVPRISHIHGGGFSDLVIIDEKEIERGYEEE